MSNDIIIQYFNEVIQINNINGILSIKVLSFFLRRVATYSLYSDSSSILDRSHTSQKGSYLFL